MNDVYKILSYHRSLGLILWGLEIHAWCIMSNHVHLVLGVSMVKTRITNCRFKKILPANLL
jgi:REP element-mobilizing transposase RayT